MSGLMDAEGVRYLLMATLLAVAALIFLSRDVQALHGIEGKAGVLAFYAIALMGACAWFEIISLTVGVHLGDYKFVRVPLWKTLPFLVMAAILLFVPMRRVARTYGFGVAAVCFLFNMGATFVWSRALDHSVLGSGYQRVAVIVPLIVLAAVGWKYSVQRGVVAGYLVFFALSNHWRGFWDWVGIVADGLPS